jgi:hypothetical protein
MPRRDLFAQSVLSFLFPSQCPQVNAAQMQEAAIDVAIP